MKPTLYELPHGGRTTYVFRSHGFRKLSPDGTEFVEALEFLQPPFKFCGTLVYAFDSTSGARIFKFNSTIALRQAFASCAGVPDDQAWEVQPGFVEKIKLNRPPWFCTEIKP